VRKKGAHVEEPAQVIHHLPRGWQVCIMEKSAFVRASALNTARDSRRAAACIQRRRARNPLPRRGKRVRQSKPEAGGTRQRDHGDKDTNVPLAAIGLKVSIL